MLNFGSNPRPLDFKEELKRMIATKRGKLWMNRDREGQKQAKELLRGLNFKRFREFVGRY